MNLIFVISPPRSGSTMLQRMLGSHSAIDTHPEPHLITPLYYLGYYDTVERSPYDHITAGQAMREFVDALPHGEADYLDALRAYANTLYERALAPSGKTYFVDKTPANALVLPFLRKLYPHAKYIVLTRHPMAVMHSVAHSFFGGDYEAAEAASPIVRKYVPAIGAFLLDNTVPHVRVRYEDLVQDPEAAMAAICTYLNVPYEARMVDYGKQKHVSKSFGDPVSVEKHQRPVTDSLTTWAQDLLANPAALHQAQRTVENLEDVHLTAWGYPKDTLFDALGKSHAVATRRARMDAYQLKRRVLLAVRKNVQHNMLGTTLRKLRYACDVLLRA